MKTLNSGFQHTGLQPKDTDPWKKGNHQPSLLPWISKPWCRKATPRQRSVDLSWGDGSWELREMKADKSSHGRGPQRRELHKGQLQRPAEGTPQVFNNVLVRTGTRGSYPRRGRGVEEIVLGTHTRLGIEAVSTNPHRKPLNPGSTG